MRNHSARVVLGACLLAAAAAAQAPASSSFSSGSYGAGLSSGSADASRGLFAAAVDADTLTSAGSLASEGAPRSATARDWSVLPQESDDHSMRRYFNEDHGEFMSLRERYNPQIELRARVFPNMRIQDEPGSFDLLGYDFDMELPTLVSTDGYLILGAYYTGRRYLTSSAFGTRNNTSGVGDETLIGAGLKLGFGVFLDNNVLFEMQTNPGAWSDLDDTVHHQDFDFPSHALFTIRAMDRFFFKVGARYNQTFEEAAWLPLLGFSWEITPGFRLDLLAPQSVEFSIWPTASTGITIGGQIQGAEYHVHTAEALNQRANVRVQEAVAYLGLVQRVTDSFSFEARAGLVVAGDYKLSDGSVGFDYTDGTLRQAFYGEFSMGLNF